MPVRCRKLSTGVEGFYLMFFGKVLLPLFRVLRHSLDEAQTPAQAL
jgi:hypothetical protein